MPERWVRSRTIAYSWGASVSETGTAPAARTAILSENQYEPPTKTSPRTSPMMKPPWPKNEPTPMKSAASAVSSTTVLTLFLNICVLPPVGEHQYGTRNACEVAANHLRTATAHRSHAVSRSTPSGHRG